MKFRKLRIAWSIFWGLACVLLVVACVRSDSVLLAADTASHLTARDTTDIKSILAPREVEVQLLSFRTPDEIAKIHEKITSAMTAKRQWVLDYVKTVKPGGFLPYHENFGVSRDEYEKYRDFMTHIKFEPYATGRLRF